MKKQNKFFTGAILGAVTGLIVGLLTTKKTGAETRKDWEKKGKLALKKGQENLEKIKVTTEEYYTSAKTKGKSFLDRLFDKETEETINDYEDQEKTDTSSQKNQENEIAEGTNGSLEDQKLELAEENAGDLKGRKSKKSENTLKKRD